MKYRICLLAFLLFHCNNISKKENNQVRAKQKQISNDTLKVYNFKSLKPLLNKRNDTTYIVNFWATWCAPCVKELPIFEKIGNEYRNENVKVYLVSLDFPKQYKSKLKPFIKKHNLQSEVLALNDVDANTWIPQVNPDWSGAIPATLIYKNEQKQFYERTFTYKDLKTELEIFLTN